MSKFDHYLDNIDAHIDVGMPFDGNVIKNPKELFSKSLELRFIMAEQIQNSIDFWESING